MGNKLPNWSYSEKGDKVAGCFPYYDEQENNYCGMMKIGPITSGWDDKFEKTGKNFIEKSSLSLDLTDVVRRICGEEDTSIGHVVFGPISNERDEEGELTNDEISISLSIEESPQEEVLEKEVQKGFYKGNLISYPSDDGTAPEPPPEPDWQNFILKVDASIPPENSVWKNQIEGEADMISGGTFTINDDEVVFNTTAYAYYPTTTDISGELLNNFTFYLIAKAEGINTEATNKHQDLLCMGMYNYSGTPGNPLLCDVAREDELLGFQRVGIYRLILSTDTDFWKNYHIYTFTKEENENVVNCYIDGSYCGQVSFSSAGTQQSQIAIYLNSYLKVWRVGSVAPSTLNGYPNHYKLFAYSSEVHNLDNITHYVEYFKSHYNV